MFANQNLNNHYMTHYYANRFPEHQQPKSARTPRNSSSYLPATQPQFSAAYEAPVRQQTAYNYTTQPHVQRTQTVKPVHFNVPYGSQSAPSQYIQTNAVDPYASQQSVQYAVAPSSQTYQVYHQQPQVSIAPQAAVGYSSQAAVMSQMNCIIEPTATEGGLYLGGYEAATNQMLLEQNNVRAVLTLTSENRIKYMTDQVQFHKYVQALDDPKFDMSLHFEQCVEFIENARKNRINVLVHCMAGISRSATIILAYLMKIYKYRFDDALHFVRARRSIVKPNDGFVQQLRRMEMEGSPTKKSSAFSFFDWF